MRFKLVMCVLFLRFPLLSLQDRAKRKFAVAEGDHITMINVYTAFLKVSANFCPGAWDITFSLSKQTTGVKTVVHVLVT